MGYDISDRELGALLDVRLTAQLSHSPKLAAAIAGRFVTDFPSLQHADYHDLVDNISSEQVYMSVHPLLGYTANLADSYGTKSDKSFLLTLLYFIPLSCSAFALWWAWHRSSWLLMLYALLPVMMYAISGNIYAIRSVLLLLGGGAIVAWWGERFDALVFCAVALVSLMSFVSFRGYCIKVIRRAALCSERALLTLLYFGSISLWLRDNPTGPVRLRLENDDGPVSPFA